MQLIKRIKALKHNYDIRVEFMKRQYRVMLFYVKSVTSYKVTFKNRFGREFDKRIKNQLRTTFTAYGCIDHGNQNVKASKVLFEALADYNQILTLKKQITL